MSIIYLLALSACVFAPYNQPGTSVNCWLSA